MISCLTNYIGIRDVTGYNNPESGTYINGLPGISTDILDEISQDEDYTLQSAWEDILNRSITRFEGDLNAWAVKYYLNYSYMSNVITGQYDTSTAIATSNNYNGWLFDFFTYSKNLKLQIESVDLYLSSSVSSSIKIWNATTGELLDTIDFNGSVGLNTIRISKEYAYFRYPRIYIGGLNIAKKRISTGDSIMKVNMNGAASTGMIVNFNVICSLDNFVCNRRELFKEPFWYLLGVEFCNERLYSDRINRYTLLNRDEAKELRDQFDAEYKMKINGALKGLKMTYNDECFVCNQGVNFRTMLP